MLDFQTPDYLVKGLIQRSFLYSMTGVTGAGKTSVTLRLAAAVATGTPFHGRATKKGRVLYLAAENPIDVQMRWIALSQHMNFPPDIDVVFNEGSFKISENEFNLRLEAGKYGDFALVIVDTGPAFFEGADESARREMQIHAMRLRSLIEIIPGKPTVIVTTHPIKRALDDNLIPAGGGNFLDSVDGNFALSKGPPVMLHTQGKFRGVEFAPLLFELRTVTHERLKDSDGDCIPTVVCYELSDEAAAEIEASQQRFLQDLMSWVSANPNRKASYSEIARELQWNLKTGEPNKMRVKRSFDDLVKAKLITKDPLSGTFAPK